MLKSNQQPILSEFVPCIKSLKKAGAEILDTSEIFDGTFARKMIKKHYDQKYSNILVLSLCSKLTQKSQCVRIRFTLENKRRIRQIILNAETGIPIEREDEDKLPLIREKSWPTPRVTHKIIQERG